MVPEDLVTLCEMLNPQNKPGRLTVIVRMGAAKLREKFPALVRAVRQAGCIVTWVSDPMHGNTIKAPSGLKTRPFDAILVSSKFSTTLDHIHMVGVLSCTFSSHVLLSMESNSSSISLALLSIFL